HAVARVLDDEAPRHLVVPGELDRLVDVAAQAVDVDPAVGDLGYGGALRRAVGRRNLSARGPREEAQPEHEPQGQQERPEELHRRTLENVDHRVSQRRKYWT